MLWKLACNSFHVPSSYYFKLCGSFNLKNIRLLKDIRKSDVINVIKINLKRSTHALNKDSKKSLSKCIAVLSFVGAGVGSVKVLSGGLSVVNCAKGNVKKLPRTTESDPKFDWYLFYKFLLPDVWFLILAIGFAVFAAVLNVEIPICLGKLVNVMTKFVQHKEGVDFSNETKQPALLLLALYLVQSVATFAYISLLSCVGERVAARMKTALFTSIIEQDLAFFDKVRTGELIDRLTSDVQEFKSSFKLCISQGLRSFTQIAGCVVSLYIISPTLTSIMVVVVPSIIVVGTFMGTFLRSMSRNAQLQAAKAVNHGEEVISNIRTVRAFANENKESERFEKEVCESCRLYERLGIGIGLFQAGTNFFLNGIVLGTLYCGGYLMSANELTAGDLMSFLVATQTIQKSMAQMSLLFGSFLKGVQAGARVFELINQEPHIHLHIGKIIPHHCLIPEVVFKDVTFAYPTRPDQVILKDFNLTLPAGKTVAIVGTSGNGKTTVAGLLERFYDVVDGSVTVGGIDVRMLNPSWLRGRVIGMINQEPILFATSVMENIRYGKPEASDEEVFAAAKLANANEFIMKFPEGYNTVMGERGVTVSGGQKQRIAIARALLKNPSILILDEATSALDTESEKVVQKALDEVTKQRTVLIIAHRLSTVKNADVIVVLNNGVIVEMGNHDELIRKKGHYWNLMNQQNIDKRALG